MAVDNPEVRAAVAYATRMHAGQWRGDGSPFILHPLEVGWLLQHADAPDHLVAAGVLHDVIEKSDASASELLDSFGPQVTSLVLAVTEDPRIAGEANRKAALRRQVATTGGEALMLFAADKLAKLRELASVPDEESDPASRAGHRRARRIEHYRACLRLLERYIPDFPLVPTLHNELLEWLGDRTHRETLVAASR
jgi:(p)ppGpp synthase/HD superfamily hydrolase